MQRVKLPGGETICYKTQGNGPAILQIHGSAFGHRNFEKLTPPMLEFCTVIDFDLPGYGESSGASRPDGMNGLADLVAEFIIAIGQTRLHIHGTSFGAMIGLTLAARHPELVDRLVLSCFLARYDNAARMMRGTWKRAARDSGMAAVADLTSVAGFARGFYDCDGAQDQLQSMRDAFAKTLPEAFIAGTEIIEKTDLSPLVAQLKSPTLLLAGKEDNMTPFRPGVSGVGMAQIAAQLPGARTIQLDDCGHYLVIEQPQQAARLIQDFLNAQG